MKDVDTLLKDLTNVYQNINRCYYSSMVLNCTDHINIGVGTVLTNKPGRPKFNISKETLKELRGIGFTWARMSQIFQVLRWTIMRRVEKYNLQRM